jgi:hypothetical protein
VIFTLFALGCGHPFGGIALPTKPTKQPETAAMPALIDHENSPD